MVRKSGPPSTATITTMEPNSGRYNKRKLSPGTVTGVEKKRRTNDRVPSTVEDLCSSNSSSDRASASCSSSTVDGSTDKFQEETKEEEGQEGVEVETSSMWKREETMTTRPSTEFGGGEEVIDDDLDSKTSKPQSVDDDDEEEEEEGECSPRPRRMEEKIIMPTKEELAAFFAEAERELQEQQKKFMEKYNFDIIKDEPMEGRYEWVRLSP